MAFCAAKVSAVCEVERAATFLRLGRRPASPDRASLATAWLPRAGTGLAEAAGAVATVAAPVYRVAGWQT